MSAKAFEGQRALVMGLGSFGGGTGAVRFLCGAGATVTATDLRDPAALEASLGELDDLDLRLVLGEHRPEDFRAADVVVVNPAVAPDHELVALAREHGARVVSAVQLFLEHTRSRVAAVTGTQGKSTTVSLATQLLARAGLETNAGGNIGGSLLPEVDAIPADSVSVLELSSYQLAALDAPVHARAEVVAVTNVHSDHLERHGTPERYARAKARVLELVDEGGTAVLPARAPFGTAVAEDLTRGFRGRIVRFGAGGEARVEDGRFRLGDEVLGAVDDLRLLGAFQRANALVALTLARLLGASPDALAESVPTLDGLEHRLQELPPVQGRRVFDNGVSTTPESTLAALAELEPACVLLCGGRAKTGLSFRELARAARDRGDTVVAFGASAPELEAAFHAAGADVRTATTLAEALETAFAETPEGRAVLFSPACASFDAYPNFFARARDFLARLEVRRG